MKYKIPNLPNIKINKFIDEIKSSSFYGLYDTNPGIFYRYNITLVFEDIYITKTIYDNYDKEYHKLLWKLYGLYYKKYGNYYTPEMRLANLVNSIFGEEIKTSYFRVGLYKDITTDNMYKISFSDINKEELVLAKNVKNSIEILTKKYETP